MGRLHFVLLPLPSWGRIAAENHIVTILMAPNFLDKTHSEVARQFPNGHEGLQRIRIVSMFDSTEIDIFQLFKPFAETYPAAYETLYKEEPIKGATTGKIFEAAPPPAAVIMDFFAVPQLGATRALSGASVPIVAWVTGGASTILRLFGPESMGGWVILVQRSMPKPHGLEKTLWRSAIRHTDGTVINIPGLPPMYDYEFFPQKLPFVATASPIVRDGHAFLMACDSVIISTAEAYEPVSLKALDSWLATLSKPLYAVGPLLPPKSGRESQLQEKDMMFKTFMDGMLAQYGEHSVFLISFGTVFWPTAQDYVDQLVEVLLEKKAPFILCHASPFAKMSKEVSDKINNSSIGLLTTWAPQQFILNHPATGWFLTHGGHGGIMESLSSGVPLICWPFNADQPAAAKHLTQNLDVAFELMEVRTGLGLQPSHGNNKVPAGTREAVGIEIRNIIDESRGDAGREKRENVAQLKVAFAKAWDADGPARRALQACLATHN